MLTAKKDNRTGHALGTGRRKTAVARIRITNGNGKITVNGRPYDEYFPTVQDQNAVTSTLDAVGVRQSVDVEITA
ncbi:MAG TPA: 30S ribosomal protein S9, partial [Pirellulaceae bacterium]|nr:30S ribosomal protein S9 [Pirellulaceae bacterium]